MAGTYKIAAQPKLFSEGPLKGMLEGVTFTASSRFDTQEWFADNRGQFVAAFSKLMPRSLATVIVAALLHGDTIELPGLFREHQIDSGFRLEWSPVHFVVPPDLKRDAELVESH
jgi:hypothetical protein